MPAFRDDVLGGGDGVRVGAGTEKKTRRAAVGDRPTTGESCSSIEVVKTVVEVNFYGTVCCALDRCALDPNLYFFSRKP